MGERLQVDACALMAYFGKEDGCRIVAAHLANAALGAEELFINRVNLLEVYYKIRDYYGRDRADEILRRLRNSQLKIEDKMSADFLHEAGRLKLTYKISMADAVFLADAKINRRAALTSDHHEFDALEINGEEIEFAWIR